VKWIEIAERRSNMIVPMMKSLAALAVLAVVFGGAETTFAHERVGADHPPRAPAEAPQLKRTMVIKSDLDGIPGKQMQAWVAEMAVGATSGWHSHPYDEFVYILDGAVTMQVKGDAPVTLHAGETFHAPPNTAHRATNASDTAQAKGLVFGLTSEGEPLAVPVKE
jgi:quercetin dioxygenase-like cupin family protein